MPDPLWNKLDERSKLQRLFDAEYSRQEKESANLRRQLATHDEKFYAAAKDFSTLQAWARKVYPHPISNPQGYQYWLEKLQAPKT